MELPVNIAANRNRTLNRLYIRLAGKNFLGLEYCKVFVVTYLFAKSSDFCFGDGFEILQLVNLFVKYGDVVKT